MIIEAIGGVLIGIGLSSLAANFMFNSGYWISTVKHKGWSGWACQYPGKMPRLYGAKEIAEINNDPQNGDRLFKVVEVKGK